MKNYYILFLLLGLLSCREEIFLELDAADEKLVVEGHIEPGFPPYLILSKNQGYFDPLDSNTFSNIFVSEADVVVYKIENNIEIDSLNLTVNQEILDVFGFPIFTNFLEFNPSFSEEGFRYNLKINWNNKIITSTTTIPYSTPLESIFIKDTIVDVDKPWKCEISAVYTDPDTIGNNILIRSKRLETYVNIDSNSSIPNFINQPDPSMLLVDCGPDVLINGSTFETFFPRPKPEGGFPNGKYNTFRYKKFNDGIDSVFVKEDIVLIKFCQVDNASMKLWRGVVRNATSGGNPFAEPANLTTNIIGGLGVWSGYGTKYYKVSVIKDTIIYDEYLPEILDIF